MTILGWYQPIYIFNDFPLFFSVLLVFMNTQIKQIWLIAYLTMKLKAYVLALIKYKF